MWPLVCYALCCCAAPPDAWPAFRGSGDSTSAAQRLPLAWSKESGIAWTAPLTGTGQSSPVIWRDRVFATSVDGPNKERAVVACFDLASGRKLWEAALDSAEPAPISDYTSRAAPTPAVDGERVYAFFETGNLAAWDHDGKLAWSRNLAADYGKFLGNHGVGSSVALTEQLAIVLVDHDGPSYLLAVDKATGQTVWKTDRPKKVSWSSPIVAGSQVIVSSGGTCEAFEAATGQRVWSVEGITGNTVPSATVTDELVCVGSSEVGSNLAIRRGGQGDVSASHIAWRSREATATFSSPLVYGGQVYLVNRAGVAFCLDEKNGKTRWTHRLGGSCWASPLGACGRVYFFEKSGATTVAAAGPEFKLLAENTLSVEDRVYGVAAVEDKIVVRSGTQLCCLETRTEKASTKDSPPMPPANEPSAAKPGLPTSTANAPAEPSLPDLPKPITSFGAAELGGALYVYGGFEGKAHHYYDQGQSGDLLRLKLRADGQADGSWEKIASGPRLQGLALVASGGSLYRVGGFEARNKEGDKQDLWSSAEFVGFQPKTAEWFALPAMPTPRSSFDANVVDSTIYVVGGWNMRGDQETVWHDTALAFNPLSKAVPQWEELPKPPFQRRALSVGSFQGRIYAIGGMQPDGKVSRRVDIYTPATRAWSEGPELPGEAMEGFGTACCTAADRFYVSTSSGKLLRLSDDGKSWELVRKLQAARFFHRMLPVPGGRLALLAGANMEQGKYATVELAPTAPLPDPATAK